MKIIVQRTILGYSIIISIKTVSQTSLKQPNFISGLVWGNYYFAQT